MTLAKLPYDSGSPFISPFQTEAIPSTLNFPSIVPFTTHVINMDKIRNRPVSTNTPQFNTVSSSVEISSNHGIATGMRLHTPISRVRVKPVVKEANPTAKQEVKTKPVVKAEKKKPVKAVATKMITKPDPIKKQVPDKPLHLEVSYSLASKPATRTKATPSPAISKRSVSVGPVHDDLQDTMDQTSDVLNKMREMLVSTPVDLSLSQEGSDVRDEVNESFDEKVKLDEPRQMSRALSSVTAPMQPEIARNSIAILPKEPEEEDDEDSSKDYDRYSPKNENKEFEEKNAVNDIKESVGIPEDIPEVIECQESETIQPPLSRFISSADLDESEVMKPLESTVNMKTIVSESGIQMEQQIRISRNKKIAPAAETHLQKSDGILEPWSQHTFESDIVKYVSETDREQVIVPYESDEEQPMNVDQNFYIYDESGIRKDYDLKFQSETIQ